jgi:hypothetical protein
MAITMAPVSLFHRAEPMPRNSIFLSLEDAKKDNRLSSSRFTPALLLRVVSAVIICGHFDPKAPELFDKYCTEVFDALGCEPFVLLPEPGFPPVIITALNARWMRDLSGIARRPRRQHP